MRKLLLVLFSILAFDGYSQITVDESLTTQQLIEDVLINSTCAESSNYLQLTGTDFGDGNGIGAFDRNGSDFPYESGIVLTSGYVSNVPGPNFDLNNDGAGSAWADPANGDPDLAAILGISSTTLINCSWIQFDFVPQTDILNFNFLLASEEYNQNFECTFSDSFAFILTNNVTGLVQNLAVLPGTTIPIQVTNIHPDVPGQCSAQNEVYFDKYNFDPFNPAATAAIDYNGQIVSLEATGPVSAGTSYTIKLVVADQQDALYDVAVFLEAGSFDIGDVDLGVDLTVATGNARCEGEAYTINPDITAPPGTDYEWFFEDPIGSGVFTAFTPPETGPNLDVFVTGNYQLVVNFGGSCETEGEVYIEFDQPIVFNTSPASLLVCDSNADGFAPFNLHDADDDITLSDPTLIVTYHPTLSDAQNGLNELSDPYTNDDPFNDVVFGRVISTESSCFETVILTLEVRSAPDIIAPAAPLRACDYDNPGDGLEFFDLSSVATEVLDGLDPLLYDIYYYEQEADAITAGDLALTAPD
ncbi:choice-of-anchor L domain-containing protein, partial [Ulvibacter antarcticus]